MLNRLITDAELVNAFGAVPTAKKRYTATFIPKGADNHYTIWDDRTFYANSKPEAQKIAREYAKRIIGMQLVYVYVKR